MLSSFGAFITTLNDSAVANVVLPVFILALLIAGFTFMVGNHEHAKQRATWAFIGAGGALLAKTIATAVQAGVPH